MALPSFNTVWSSRQDDEEKMIPSENFFLFGSSRAVDTKIPTPTFRANPNFRWFSDMSLSSKLSCCERSFATQDQLEKHRSEHVKCFTKDCEFEAHPDVVEKHFNMQHRNSLYKKVCLTNRPEDIARWISERKRNFPTRDRIIAKKEEAEKRRERGEVIERRNFGLMRRGRGRSFDARGGRRGSLQRGLRGAFRGGICGRGRGRGLPIRKTAQMEGIAYSRPEEDPLACLPNYSSGSEEKDEKETKTQEKMEKEDEDDRPVEISSKVPPALSLIASCYDSSEEEEEEATKEAKKKFQEEKVKENETKDEEETKKDCPTARESENVDPRPPPAMSAELRGNDPVLRLVRRRERCMEDRRKILTRPRLLEMLLARDIQHERNVLMQCCFFITARNFFGRCPAAAVMGKSEVAAPAPAPAQPPPDDEVWEGVL